ncbi:MULTISPECIES: hypothetical protein [Tetragenococcus]|uniref:Uncharacterized protein n=2 Tax=Tetragenococcus TaxID=51668 RepID=A0AAN4RLR5_9ENTE|nr:MULTISPECIES: hypothetical protein [Tetragenococcus]MCF1616324.1 hypothetical protein [Tetragenococcus koreensis]MCF1621237.1 hypothetical protein [Tetragenococcus koreensis]MCF1626704.1 hypothetical protein [Tetragenococcus koreensis]MCF1631842.1 hypothetical protein [Tetragenococcus koreensis]MCF1677286.1 hypothetical protein [Tetragenococcus koreensis]
MSFAINVIVKIKKDRRIYIFDYIKKGNYYITDTQQLAQEHDRQIIEESFADSEKVRPVSEEKMQQEFGKYGWGK